MLARAVLPPSTDHQVRPDARRRGCQRPLRSFFFNEYSTRVLVVENLMAVLFLFFWPQGGGHVARPEDLLTVPGPVHPTKLRLGLCGAHS